jgi:hypothetical protein
MKKILAIAGLATLAAGAFAQSNLATRVFTYDGSQATNGLSNFEVDNTTVSNSGTSGTDTANAVSSATAGGASFGVNTTIHILTYVYMNGNFGGTFTLHGAGSNTDAERDNDVEIRANRPLTFTTSAFTTLLNADTTSAATVGSIAYGLSLYADNPANTIVGSAITGTDAAFNAQHISFALSDLPADGKMTLHLARTLSLTQLAAGATTYNATGTIAVTVG